MDRMRFGMVIKAFQAMRHAVTLASQPANTRLESWFSRDIAIWFQVI